MIQTLPTDKEALSSKFAFPSKFPLLYATQYHQSSRPTLRRDTLSRQAMSQTTGDGSAEGMNDSVADALCDAEVESHTHSRISSTIMPSRNPRLSWDVDHLKEFLKHNLDTISDDYIQGLLNIPPLPERRGGADDTICRTCLCLNFDLYHQVRPERG